jgi:hypothetical protein
VIARHGRTEEDRAATGPIGREVPFQETSRRRVEAVQRLVENQQREVRQQRGEEPQLLGRPLGITSDRAVERGRIELDLLGENGGLGTRPPPAMEEQRHAHELMAQQIARWPKPLRKVGKVHATAWPVMRFAKHPHGPRMRGDQHQYRFQQTGLAGAVPPDQAERLVLPNRERDVLERRRRAIACPHTLDLESMRGCQRHLGLEPRATIGTGGPTRDGPPNQASALPSATLPLIRITSLATSGRGACASHRFGSHHWV